MIVAAAYEEHSEWRPNNGLERTFFTAASTILVLQPYGYLRLAYAVSN